MDAANPSLGSNEAIRRQRRTWKVVLVCGIVLGLGPALGLIGTVLGMIQSFNKIESMAAPTPDDLAGGVRLAMAATTVGLITGVAGVALIVVSCIKLGRLRPDDRRVSPAAPTTIEAHGSVSGS